MRLDFILFWGGGGGGNYMLKLIFCKYTTSVDIQKRAIKKLVTHVESYTSVLMCVCVSNSKHRFTTSFNHCRI